MPFFKKPLDTQIEIYANEPQTEHRLRFLKRIFKFTFLIFRDDAEEPIKFPQLIFCILIVLASRFHAKHLNQIRLDGYQTAYILWNKIEQTRENLTTSLVVVIWYIQCFASSWVIVF